MNENTNNTENSPEEPKQEIAENIQPVTEHTELSQPVTESKTDVLGIVSIVLAFVFPLAGLIVGLIGANKAKKEGHSPILSRIGWIVNLVFVIIGFLFIILIFLSVPALQRNARSTSQKNNLSLLSADLQSFYSTHRYYPASLSQLDSLAKNTDPNGKTYIYKPTPEGCIQCRSYILQTTLENGDLYELKP